MKHIPFFIPVAVLLILACSHSPKPYAVFDYEDFGPQAMAWETLGMQWWQWEDHGTSDGPHDRYDIKVVVYRGITLAQMQKILPVNESRKQDLRYLAYSDALRYLDDNIGKLKPESEQWAVDLRRRLIETRERIQRRFDRTNADVAGRPL